MVENIIRVVLIGFIWSCSQDIPEVAPDFQANSSDLEDSSGETVVKESPKIEKTVASPSAGVVDVEPGVIPTDQNNSSPNNDDNIPIDDPADNKPVQTVGQPINLAVTEISSGKIRLSWESSGAGTQRFLVVQSREGEPVNFVPLDGVDYAVGKQGDHEIIFNGQGTELTADFSNEIGEKTYGFAVYAANNLYTYSQPTSATSSFTLFQRYRYFVKEVDARFFKVFEINFQISGEWQANRATSDDDVDIGSYSDVLVSSVGAWPSAQGFKAFDNNSSTTWDANDRGGYDYTGPLSKGYSTLEFDFGTAIEVTGMRLLNDDESRFCILDAELQVWNGIDWVIHPKFFYRNSCVESAWSENAW